METLWQRYVAAVLAEDSQAEAGRRTLVTQTTIGRWLRGEVRPTNAANVAAFAQDYGRNVLEAFVAAELLGESDAKRGLSDFDRAFLKRLRSPAGQNDLADRAARKWTRPKRQT